MDTMTDHGIRLLVALVLSQKLPPPPPNFTYSLGGTMSVIDKALVNLSPTEVMALNITVSTTVPSCNMSRSCYSLIVLLLWTMTLPWCLTGVLQEAPYEHIVVTLISQYVWPSTSELQHDLLRWVQDAAWRYYCDDACVIPSSNFMGICQSTVDVCNKNVWENF